MKVTVEKAIAKAEQMMYEDSRFHAGVERKAVAKEWEKNGAKRTYINVYCYSLMGNYKGSYKCGYVDMLTDEYVCTKYDDVNLFED